jgi:hypothetical protein
MFLASAEDLLVIFLSLELLRSGTFSSSLPRFPVAVRYPPTG